ncbi:hypothetical protein BJ742DRAFT_267744 [Cladochytrium replicatum]|nr:hypothetical protein BJ742DRAFT_267744 [Cladochytrium replicatum]
MNRRRKEHQKAPQQHSPAPRSAFSWLFQITSPPPPVTQKLVTIPRSLDYTSDRFSTLASSVLILICCVPFCFLLFKFRVNQAQLKSKHTTRKSLRPPDNATPSDGENLISESTRSVESNRINRSCPAVSSSTPKKRIIPPRPSTPLLRTVYLQSSTPSAPSPSSSNRSISRQSSIEKLGTASADTFGTTTMDRPSTNYASLSHHKLLADLGYKLTREAIELEERGDVVAALDMYRKGLRDLKMALKLQFQSLEEREKAETLNQKLRSNIRQIEERVKDIGINASRQSASHSLPSSHASSGNSALKSTRSSRPVSNKSSNSNLKSANKFEVYSRSCLFLRTNVCCFRHVDYI